MEQWPLDRAVAEELYGLAPEEFIAARNQAVRTAKDAGNAATAAAVAALRKPTLAAWLANQLVRADPDGIHQLTELGEQLRTAHLSGDGATVRRLTTQRHTVIDQLTTAADGIATANGRRISPQIRERLGETLDAALVDPGAAQLLRSGQLTSALRHVGFGVVDETGDPAQLVPVRPRVVRTTPSRLAKHTSTVKRATATAPVRRSPADDTLARRRAALQVRAERAEDDYQAAELERAETQQRLDVAQQRVADLESDRQRLTEQLDQTRNALRRARKDLPRLQRALDRATRQTSAVARRRDAEQHRLARSHQ